MCARTLGVTCAHIAYAPSVYDDDAYDDDVTHVTFDDVTYDDARTLHVHPHARLRYTFQYHIVSL